MDWEARHRAAVSLRASRAAAAEAPDGEAGRADLQVAAYATASWAEGLSALMLGRGDEARAALGEAADVYRRSHSLAPAGSWGRPLAALRCRLIAGDEDGAHRDAEWTLALGAEGAPSAVGRYAATLALLTLGRDADARPLALQILDDDGFGPRAVALALVALAAGDAPGYTRAAEELITDFERREAFLEDVAVADTVLVLDRLAGARGLARPARPSSLLPPPRPPSASSLEL
jgi:hypothetical protein